MSQNGEKAIQRSKDLNCPVAAETSSSLETPLKCEAGSATLSDLNMSTRKPPFHLPPLDPNVFEKSRSPKPAGSSREKKKKLGKKKLTVSISDSCLPVKNENNESINLHTDDNGVRYELPLKKIQKKRSDSLSSRKLSELPVINQIRKHENEEPRIQETQKSRLVIDKGEFSARIPHRRGSRLNQIASTMEVLPSKKAIRKTGSFHGSDGPKLRRSSHFAPQTDLSRAGSSSAFGTGTPTGSRFGSSHAGSPTDVFKGERSNIFCTEIPRMRRRSRSLGDIISDEMLPSQQDSATLTGRFSGCTHKHRVPVRVQSATKYKGTILAHHNNREENSLDSVSAIPVCPNPQQEAGLLSNVVRQPGCSKSSDDKARIPFRVQTATTSRRDPAVFHSSGENAIVPGSFLRGPTSNGKSDAVGIGSHDSAVVNVVRRSSSQQDLSQYSQSPGTWRVRRVGMCKATENNTSMTERLKARVLMKKFGVLDNPCEKD